MGMSRRAAGGRNGRAVRDIVRDGSGKYEIAVGGSEALGNIYLKLLGTDSAGAVGLGDDGYNADTASLLRHM